jgi:hypothetical protein
MSTTEIQTQISTLRGYYAIARMNGNTERQIRLEGRIQDAMESLRLAQIAAAR